MSEEEIIKYLKNVIKTIQESDMLFDEPANIRCGIKMKGAIQGLLDLYNKEKEKNKKIKDGILFVGRRNGKNAEQKMILDEYIRKDKIKEKIEWLEKNIIDNDYASENDKDVAENQIYILEWLI